ncbi:MAG: DNA polymerase IV [Proteobacteria bacterium]|nr:DNA polymerase IV [Pseudomonadota bacterium]
MLQTLCRDCFKLAESQTRPERCGCGSRRVLAHAELTELSIAHVDCDAFYASVEKRDRPELREQPVIVGGGVRGVATTACYIARQYGVRSAMPMFKAVKLCPQAVVVRPDFRKYTAESGRVFARLRALTPLVQGLSLDEAWLDLSGTERLNGGPPALTLARAQAAIEAETGLTVSVGLAPNKFLAKIASDLDKPRGFAVLGSEAAGFLSERPVGVLPGVGPVFARTLERDGFLTVGDLARAAPGALEKRYGAYGAHLAALAQGRDARAVHAGEGRKSISAETTFNEDLADGGELETLLWPLCEKVAGRARRDGLAGRAITLKLKTDSFKLLTRRCTLHVPTQTARGLFRVGRELLAGEPRRRYRLIGIGLSDLLEAAAPTDLFGDGEARLRRTESTIDGLRARFGEGAVVSGRALKH